MRHRLQIVASLVLLVSYSTSGILLEVAHHHRSIMGDERQISSVTLADRTGRSAAPSPGEMRCPLCSLVAQRKCLEPPQFSGAPPAPGFITSTPIVDTYQPGNSDLLCSGERAPPAA